LEELSSLVLANSC